jgi:hypothetical protein
MPTVQLLEKPEIRLVGVIAANNGIMRAFNKNVDNSSGTYDATGVDMNKLPNFQGSVRVIITGKVFPKPTYIRESGLLPALSFEGKNITGSTVGRYAETYYSLNDKTPVRSANYLYKYNDWDDYSLDVISNPSFPDSSDNIDGLGFFLKCPPTGASNITLKAKTYYQGSESIVAIARFKISLSIGNIIDNENSNE